MTTPSPYAPGPLHVVFHTPLPVAFRTPVPISAASPIPVHVVNGPDSWAMTAAIAAVVAAAVAVVTLVAVLRQVKLARLEVGYVKRDLDNNERLLKELMRRPDLELTVGPTASTLESTPYLPVKLAFLVANKGTKVAHEVMVEVLIPVAAVYEERIDGPHEILEHNGSSHFRLQVKAPPDSVLWPNRSSMQLNLEVRLVMTLERFQIYYRIYDEFDGYPAPPTYDTYRFERSFFFQVWKAQQDFGGP